MIERVDGRGQQARSVKGRGWEVGTESSEEGWVGGERGEIFERDKFDVKLRGRRFLIWYGSDNESTPTGLFIGYARHLAKDRPD